MRPFENTEELHSVMKSLWEEVREDKEITAKLLETRLIVRFNFQDPPGILTLDGHDGKDLKIYVGDCDIKPDVEMKMTAADAHLFWLGKLRVPMAMMQGKIRCFGPAHKAIALIPAVQPAFAIYPGVVQSVRGKAA